MPAAGPGKKLCGAKTKRGTCRNIAGKGTDHKGTGYCSRHLGSTRNHKAAAEREQTRQACAVFNLELDHRDPGQVLLDEILRARKAMAWYEQEIALAIDEGNDERRDRRWADWRLERGIAARVSVEVVRLGIERRHVEAVEDEARRAVAMLEVFGEALGLDRRDRRVIEAGHAALRVLPGGS